MLFRLGGTVFLHEVTYIVNNRRVNIVIQFLMPRPITTRKRSIHHDRGLISRELQWPRVRVYLQRVFHLEEHRSAIRDL
jgi:hypothetical protein